MKNKPEIEKLLQKFILNQCTTEEIEEVILFFQDKDSISDFPKVDQVLPLIDQEGEPMPENSTKRIYQEILKTKKEQERSRRRKKNIPWGAVAAVLVVGLILAGLYFQNLTSGAVLIPAEEDITLKMNNGTLEVLEPETLMQVTDAQGNVVASLQGNQLLYHSNTTSPIVPEYNTITVPYGKKFELGLADGTSVHLNSGTSLRYPTAFAEGEKRQVYLTGEAYFEVARDVTRPFIVNAEELKVQVLGTQFNVSAYPEDESADVVLVEGSVGMFVEGEDFSDSGNKPLEPGYLGSYHKGQQLFSKEEVISGIYTSWIEGELVFRNAAFENILKKLERHYNIKIINERKELNQITFNANFGDEPIERVLEFFSRIYKIEYTVEDNQVIIQ